MKLGASAVIFDLDGTLLDTLDDITSAANAALAEFDRPAVDQSDMRLLVGSGLHVLLQRASGIEDDAVLEKLVARYRLHYERAMLDQTHLYAGISEMLDGCQGLGVPMSVLSNKPHRFTAPIGEHYLSRWCFVRLLGHEDGTLRKPDPGVALQLAGVMGRKPSDVVFVGDSSVDILTARNAGMLSVAVTWGFRDIESLEAAGPDHIIRHPRELVPLLDV